MGTTYTRGLEDWVTANLSVKNWFDRLARKRQNTAKVYGWHLWKYWKESLAGNGYTSIDAWAVEVKKQSKDEDVQVSRKWARALEKYLSHFCPSDSSDPRLIFNQGRFDRPLI